MKTCNTCDKRKPPTDFYAHPHTKDGRFATCKECVKARVRKNYAKKRKRFAAYERERARQPQRRADQARHRKRYREKHGDRLRARSAVSNALRDGRLVRGPCCVCGTRKRVQAHHADYSKPLAVEWLCFKCHREWRHGQITT